MSKTAKTLLGIATFWPILYIFIFIGIVGFMTLGMFASAGAGGEPPTAFFAAFPVLFVFHFFTILLTLSLMGFYLYHVIRDPSLDTNMKLIWVLVILLANMAGMPVYYIIRIWKRPDPQFA